jgi:DNA-binding SARP family transcriptional activator
LARSKYGCWDLLEVLVDGALVSVGRAKRAEVVDFLALQADEVVPVESLAQALWDSEPLSDGRNAVQHHVAAA